MTPRRLALPTLSAIYANGPAALQGYQLTFFCGGHSFRCFVRARNQRAATEEGLIELASQCPDFDPDNARLVACIETS